MTKPLEQQVGGKHYKGMAIQPFEFGFANRYDDCAFTAFKYLMRHGQKNGRIDLLKAAHTCHVRGELIQKYGLPPAPLEEIPVLRMCFANKMTEAEQSVALALDRWARQLTTGDENEIAALMAKQFEVLADQVYPERTKK